jgi:hypothetical protein
VRFEAKAVCNTFLAFYSDFGVHIILCDLTPNSFTLSDSNTFLVDFAASCSINDRAGTWRHDAPEVEFGGKLNKKRDIHTVGWVSVFRPEQNVWIDSLWIGDIIQRMTTEDSGDRLSV